jgi:hypothetical protein
MEIYVDKKKLKKKSSENSTTKQVVFLLDEKLIKSNQIVYLNAVYFRICSQCKHI